MSESTPMLPAYGSRSLAELVPALLVALRAGMSPTAPRCGTSSSAVRAEQSALAEIEPAGRVCLLLVDGLGADQLAEHPADAPFLSSLLGRAPLSAGFPSSTPVSLSSLGTGVPPGAHGVLGVRFEATHGELLDAISWTTHKGGRQVDQREALPPEQVQPLDTALARAESEGVDVRVVSARAFEGSGLTRAALRGGQYRGVFALGDLAAELVTALRAPAPVFCYGYHAQLDLLGHVYGPGSLPWRLELRVIDQVAALVAETLPPDGLLVVTADHGMVTIEDGWRIDADTDDALRAGVRLIGGDPRARHVYAEPGAAADVLATWTERLGERAWVRSGERAVAEGWFGPSVTDVARSRIGDVVVALRGGWALTRSHAESRLSALVGQHGSLTGAEQRVPLLLARG